MSTTLSQHHYQPMRKDEDPRTITTPALILSKQILQGKKKLVCGWAAECTVRPLKNLNKLTSLMVQYTVELHKLSRIP